MLNSKGELVYGDVIVEVTISVRASLYAAEVARAQSQQLVIGSKDAFVNATAFAQLEEAVTGQAAAVARDARAQLDERQHAARELLAQSGTDDGIGVPL